MIGKNAENKGRYILETNLKVWLAGAADKVTTSALKYLSWRSHWLIADLQSERISNSIPKFSCEENQNTDESNA